MAEQLTLYSNKASQYAHAVEIVLEEAKAQYTRYEVDLLDKPAWFAEKVNPIGEVPAMTYGGPTVPPEHPSSESIKLAESEVLIEFVNELCPHSAPFPKDVILRAKARFFIRKVNTALTRIYIDGMRNQKSPEGMLDAMSNLQRMLPDESQGKYALGNEFTAADAVAAGWLLRMDCYLSRDIGSWKAGEGRKIYEELQAPKYARYRAYLEVLRQRESVRKTYDEAFILRTMTSFYLARRA